MLSHMTKIQLMLIFAYYSIPKMFYLMMIMTWMVVSSSTLILISIIKYSHNPTMIEYFSLLAAVLWFYIIWFLYKDKDSYFLYTEIVLPSLLGLFLFTFLELSIYIVNEMFITQTMFSNIDLNLFDQHVLNMKSGDNIGDPEFSSEGNSPDGKLPDENKDLLGASNISGKTSKNLDHTQNPKETLKENPKELLEDNPKYVLKDKASHYKVTTFGEVASKDSAHFSFKKSSETSDVMTRFKTKQMELDLMKQAALTAELTAESDYFTTSTWLSIHDNTPSDELTNLALEFDKSVSIINTIDSSPSTANIDDFSDDDSLSGATSMVTSKCSTKKITETVDPNFQNYKRGGPSSMAHAVLRPRKK